MNSTAQRRSWQPDLLPHRRHGGRANAVAQAPAPASAMSFWALMTFTGILLLAPQAYFRPLVAFRIALVTALVAITAHLLDRVIRQEPITIVTRELVIAAGLAGWAILTTPLSYWPGGSVSFLLDLYFKTLVIFWLLANTVTTVTRLRQVAWALSLMAIPLAMTGVAQYLSGDFIAVAGPVKRIVGYEAPLTANPNDLALMVNLILPLTAALFAIHRALAVRALLLAIMLLDIVAVIITFSRGGFLSLATTLGIYLWRRVKPARRAAALVAFALFGALVLPAGYLDRLATITDIQSDSTGSAQLRWADTVAAVKFVLKNPIIGAGAGTNALALNDERGATWHVVHNVYLEYAVELGFPGMLLFLALVGSCLTSAKFVQGRSAGVPALRELFLLAEGIWISLIAFAVAALFHPVAYHFYFYYIAGLAVALKVAYTAHGGRLDPKGS